MAYASPGDLKAALEIIDTSMDAEIQRALDAASAALDELTNVRTNNYAFTVQQATRRYTAINADLVVIDDLRQIDQVTSDGETVSATAEPLNADLDGKPFTRLVSAGRFSTGVAAVQVTGRFGWPATPSQVEQWVLVVATKLLKRLREAPFGLITGSFDGEVMRIAKEDPDTPLLVERLSRHHPVVA